MLRKIMIVLATAAALAAGLTTAAPTPQPGPVTQQRDEARIAYQQPRMQDLPPSVAQDEKKVEPELDAIAKDLNKLENRICREC
jgi:hypothetical protein